MLKTLIFILLLSLPALLFAQTAAEREARLNTALADYEKKYNDLHVPDIRNVNTADFANRLNDLKKMEETLDGLIKQELDELADSMRAGQSPHVQELYQKYLASRVEYGGAKDYRRYAAFTDLFFESQKMYQNKVPPRSFRAAIAKFGRLVKLGMKLALPGLQMMVSAFQNVTKTKVGFGTSVDRFFKKWGEASGISVEVTNRELLQNQERIRIYVPTHRDANLDALAFAALDVENPVVFGALNLKNHPIFGMKDHPMVKPMIDALEKNDTFILAGAAEKPMEKFMRLIREGKVQNVLIYPEGQVGLGIKESRPVRTNFSEAMLKTLVEAGVDFELMPVTYVNGAQYFEYHNDVDLIRVEPGQEKLLVNVQRPISSQELKQFFARFPEKDFTTYLRMNWLFDLPTNDELVLGQGRWANIQNAFQTKLTGKSCVANALETLAAP